MAIFNPQVPDSPIPNWEKSSQPISQPEADKSTGLTLATIGQGLDEAVGIADTAVKGFLKEKVETGVNATRDAHTQSLIMARNTQISGIPQPDNTLVPAEGPAIPPGLQAGVQRAQALGEAQAQNGGTLGKANDTLYTGALAAQAKQLRSQYPGYKDYIDEQIKSVSGMDPANAFYKNLLQDINTASTNTKSEADKAIALGRQWLGYDVHMPAYIEAVRRGLPNAVQNLEDNVNKIASDDAKFKIWHNQHEREVAARGDKTAATADDKETAQYQYRSELQAAGSRIFNGVVKIPGLTDPATMQKIIADDQNGINPLSDEQKGMLLSAARAAQTQYNNEAVKIQTGKGRYGVRIADQNTIDAITKGERSLYDNMVDSLGNDKYGSMFANQRRAASMQSDAEAQVLSNQDMGGYAKATSVWTKFGGPNWVNTAQGQFLAKGGLGKFTNWLEEVQNKAQTPDDLRRDGTVKSMYDDIAKAQKHAADGNNVPEKVYNNIVDNVNTIIDPKAPQNVKEEVVKYAFKPSNWKIMNQFGKDFVDSNGVSHKGQYAVFDTMTQPKITENIWNLKNRDAWDNYKNWGEQSFKTLFGNEIKTINDLQDEGSMKIGVRWDADNKRIEIDAPKPTTSVDANFIRNAQSTVNRLNSGLYNLSRIKDREGTDTSAYLVKTMVDLGLRPGEGTRGFPQQLMDAVAASKKQKRIEDAFKAAQ